MRNFITVHFTKCYLDDHIKEYEVGGHVACMGGMRNAYNILVGKPERKRPCERPRYGW
jgi:hypothetical protein